MMPVALPVRIGTESGRNPSTLYDAEGTGIAALFSINQSGTVEQARADLHCATGLERADYLVRATNACPVLVHALLQAREALAHSVPTHAHYPEPVERHLQAKKAVDGALAAVGLAEAREPRFGWGADHQGIIFTSEGSFQLIQQGLPITNANIRVARYIADAVTTLHALGGRGL